MLQDLHHEHLVVLQGGGCVMQRVNHPRRALLHNGLDGWLVLGDMLVLLGVAAHSRQNHLLIRAQPLRRILQRGWKTRDSRHHYLLVVPQTLRGVLKHGVGRPPIASGMLDGRQDDVHIAAQLLGGVAQRTAPALDSRQHDLFVAPQLRGGELQQVAVRLHGLQARRRRYPNDQAEHHLGVGVVVLAALGTAQALRDRFLAVRHAIVVHQALAAQ
mmetsp:Transcript_54964/g.141492  ORF Transcript_54964/g.141492 Transcript_54964/m.141492 type:complete len:215 (-) Transcript_54964:590-1234(-)